MEFVGMTIAIVCLVSIILVENKRARQTYGKMKSFRLYK